MTWSEVDLKARLWTVQPGRQSSKIARRDDPRRVPLAAWANEHTSYDGNLSEAALWHNLGNKVEQAYARSDMVEKRRKLMADWAAFLTGAPVAPTPQLIRSGFPGQT